MEREGRGRGENFANKKRLNIVARSVAAISIAAAGVAVVEETGSFDPITNPVNSANHLVLNNLHNSYEQLIDKLPEVEKAQAAVAAKTCRRNYLSTTFNCTGTNMPVVDNDHIAIKSAQVTGSDHICHADVTDAGSISVTATIKINDTLNYLCDFFDFGDPPNYSKTIEVFNFSPTPIPGVGGITELSDVEALPQDMNSEKSTDYTTPIAAGLAAAAAAVAATGAVLYSRKNRSTR